MKKALWVFSAILGFIIIMTITFQQLDYNGS